MIELKHEHWYWIRIGSEYEVARYDEHGWKFPTWDRVGTDELTYDHNVDEILCEVERCQ
jgi:hypothetical protein